MSTTNRKQSRPDSEDEENTVKRRRTINSAPSTSVQGRKRGLRREISQLKILSNGFAEFQDSLYPAGGASQRTHFLNLPGEIRNAIYASCVEDEQETRFTVRHCPNGVRKHSHRIGSKEYTTNFWLSHYSLTQTNAQIRREFLPWLRFTRPVCVSLENLPKYIDTFCPIDQHTNQRVGNIQLLPVGYHQDETPNLVPFIQLIVANPILRVRSSSKICHGTDVFSRTVSEFLNWLCDKASGVDRLCSRIQSIRIRPNISSINFQMRPTKRLLVVVEVDPIDEEMLGNGTDIRRSSEDTREQKTYQQVRDINGFVKDFDLGSMPHSVAYPRLIVYSALVNVEAVWTFTNRGFSLFRRSKREIPARNGQFLWVGMALPPV